MAKHYKDIGKPEGYDSKMELVGLLKQLKEYQHLKNRYRRNPYTMVASIAREYGMNGKE